ncbi:IclR family transcriptional regulator, partial [Rhizobium johnstonii]
MDKRQPSKRDIVQSVDVCIDVLLNVAKNPDIRLNEVAQNLGETKPRI